MIKFTYYKLINNPTYDFDYNGRVYDDKDEFFEDMIDFLLYEEGHKVYLCGVIEPNSTFKEPEIYVTDNRFHLEMYLSINFVINNCKQQVDVFLQEYESFEDAYKVALDLKEVNPICYNK